jgi:hypothetical protein
MAEDKDLLLSDLNHYRAIKRVLGSTLLSGFFALVIAIASNSIGDNYSILAFGLLLLYALVYPVLDKWEREAISQIEEG